MLNRQKRVQESDTCLSARQATKAGSCNEVRKQKKIIHHIVLLLFLFIASSSYAQRILTVEEAVASALQKNYDIILSRNDSTIAAIDYSYRNALFIPRVNANMGTLWNNNSQKQTLADGTKRDQSGLRSNNINAQVALSWTLFDGLKMFVLRDKAEQLLQFGELEVKDQIVNTVAAVINNYYNIVRQKQQLISIQEQMSIDLSLIHI